MYGRKQTQLESLVVEPDGRFERADQVSDDVFRRIVQQRREPPLRRPLGVVRTGDFVD